MGYNIDVSYLICNLLENPCHGTVTEVNHMQVTKKSIIGDVLDYEPETAQFFFAIGMHCLGCPASRGECIEDACAVHGTDANALIEKINAFLKAKNK